MLGVTPVAGLPGIRGGGGGSGGGPAPGATAANARGAAAPLGGGLGGAGYMERDLLGNVIPLVEKEYRMMPTTAPSRDIPWVLVTLPPLG